MRDLDRRPRLRRARQQAQQCLCGTRYLLVFASAFYLGVGLSQAQECKLSCVVRPNLVNLPAVAIWPCAPFAE